VIGAEVIERWSSLSESRTVDRKLRIGHRDSWSDGIDSRTGDRDSWSDGTDSRTDDRDSWSDGTDSRTDDI
jgi:hypothetical protein